MSGLQLSIVTPAGKAFEDTVDSLVATGVEGSFGVLPSHAPMVVALSSGPLTATRGGEQFVFDVAGGFLEVSRDHVSVLADRAKRVDGREGGQTE